MTQNTFKNNAEPMKNLAAVEITEKELAIYNYVSLKLAYQQNQIDRAIEQLHPKKADVVIQRFTMGVVISLVIAVAGLFIHSVKQ